MTAGTELPEIPADNPLTMRVLRTPQAQAVQAEIDRAVSTGQGEAETPKRRPGRPPGSKNKTPSTPRKPPATPSTSKTEAEKIAEKAKADEARGVKDKKEPPDFTEWQSFIGEVVLHWFSVAFIAVAFRHVPYHDIMSPEDYEDIQLDEDELGAVARPFAHLLTHSGINTKYGRAIMNSRDSIEASVVLFMWGNRVNRISKKYRRMWNEYQAMEGSENVARIPRPDRARDTSEEITAEQVQPIVGLTHSAFGHGFN
jgi:hypothetical protein